MARKRQKLKGLDYTSREYWNRLLSMEGLAVDAGRDPRLIPIGNSNELETLERTLSGDGRQLPHKQAE
jgi:hypothetical protein